MDVPKETTWEEAFKMRDNKEKFLESFYIYGPRPSDSAEALSALVYFAMLENLPELIVGDSALKSKIRSCGIPGFDDINFSESNEGYLETPTYHKPGTTQPSPVISLGTGVTKVDWGILSNQAMKWGDYSPDSEGLSVVGYNGAEASTVVGNLVKLHKRGKETIRVANAPKTLQKTIKTMGLEKMVKCA
jgi:hypothetical protein